MPASRSTDQELIQQIRQGDRHALEIVYKTHRDLIQRYVIKNRGTFEEAQELYQDVIASFYQNVMNDKLSVLTSKLSTYLYSLAQNQWRNKLRSKKYPDLLEGNRDIVIEEEVDTAHEDAFLQKVIARLDERCRQLLLYFYFDQLPMQEVARLVGLPNGDSAKKRKFDCLGKLKKLASSYKESDYGP